MYNACECLATKTSVVLISMRNAIILQVKRQNISKIPTAMIVSSYSALLVKNKRRKAR